jgi:hypothetical protein
VAELLIMAAAFSWWLVPFLALGAYALKYYRTARRTPRPSAPEA